MEKQTLTMDQMVDGWLSSLVGQIKESSYVKYECLARVHIFASRAGTAPGGYYRRMVTAIYSFPVSRYIGPRKAFSPENGTRHYVGF